MSNKALIAAANEALQLNKTHEHVATVYFSVLSEFNDEQTENISTGDLIAGLEKRLEYLKANLSEAGEAFHIVEPGDIA